MTRKALFILATTGMLAVAGAPVAWAQFVNGIMGPPASGPGSQPPVRGGESGGGGAAEGQGGAPAPRPQGQWVTACQPEIDKMCKAEFDQGGAALSACLKLHEKELSEGCGTQFARTFSAAAACKADMEKYCSDPSSYGGMGKCLVSHKDDLSEGCRKMLVRSSKQSIAEKKADGVEANVITVTTPVTTPAAAAAPAKRKSKK